MSELSSGRPATASYRRPHPRPRREPASDLTRGPALMSGCFGAVLGALVTLALVGEPSTPASPIPPLSIEEATRRIDASMLDAAAYAARGQARAALAEGEVDPVESLICAIEDYERALGVGGEDWAARALVESLQDAARYRLDRASSR